MPELKLTRQAFAAALKSGRGRALQYVRQYGLSEVGDLVLEACLKNQAYDRQCEGSRAAWLFAMFHGTEDESRFSAAIRATLSLPWRVCRRLLPWCGALVGICSLTPAGG